MPSRAHRLAGPVVVTNIATALFTVPASETWKVMVIDALNVGTGNPSLTLAEDDATVASKRLQLISGATSFPQTHIFPGWVFEAGHALSAVTPLVLGASMIVTVHGFKYLTP